MEKEKKTSLLRILLIVFLEIICSLILGYLAALSKYAGGALYFIAMWILMPLLGALCAYFATVKGLNNYLAWIFPPLMLFISWYICWHFVITPGPVFICALISLIGAATGDVVKKRGRK